MARFGHQLADIGGPARLCVGGLALLWSCGCQSGTNDPIDRVAGGFMIPAAQLADQDDADTRPALAAIVATRTVSVVEPKSITPAAQWAWPMSIAQKWGFNAELRQYLTPATTGSLDRAAGNHGAPLCFAISLAKAISLDLAHARTASEGEIDLNRPRNLIPNFSFILCQAQPGL